MSFITDDKELIKILVNAGQTHLDKFAQTKPVGQMAGDPSDFSPDKILPYRIAKPLLVNLQRQIDPDNAIPKTIPLSNDLAASGLPVTELDAFVKDFRTLGDFINWAANKRLTWNGKRFAWTKDEKPDDAAWTFTSLPRDRSQRDIVTREPITITAYALKPELVAFLEYLRKWAAEKSNTVLQVMIGKCIAELNTYLVASNEAEITTREKPAIKKHDLDPKTIVDKFPSNILDMQKVNVGLNSAPYFADPSLQKALTVADVSDLAHLSRWLGSMKVKNKNGKDVYFSEDPCMGIHVLYKRSKYLMDNSASYDLSVPDFSKKAALYNHTVMEYGQTLKDPETGELCEITTPESKKPIDITKDKTYKIDKVDTEKTPIGNIISQILTSSGTNLPFSMDNIDFNRIKKFLNLVVKLYNAEDEESRDRLGATISNTQNCLNYMAQTKLFMKSENQNVYIFPMRDAKLYQYTFIDESKGAIAFFTSLLNVISSANIVLNVFKNAYADKLAPNQSQLLNQQTYIYNKNSDLIKEFEYQYRTSAKRT